MAPRALSLQAYLAYARSSAALGSGPAAQTWPERRPGTLIWGHAQGREAARALVSLCTRIAQQRPEVLFVLSGDAEPPPDVPHVVLPGERSSDCEQFARALRPDFCLWAGSQLRPALLHAVRETGAHMVALPPGDGPWACPVPRWLPDPTSATLALFDVIHCPSETTRRQLRRFGVAPANLRLSGPFMDTGTPLECPDAQHEEVAGILAARPVWLAARVLPDEAADILRAHRRAVRLAHRLLLILVPADAQDYDTIARITQSEQMRTCHWDSGESPDENTQVLLVEGPEELGLWFRIAPLAFLGGSLIPGRGGSDPYEAAALGTAILYGPNVGRHLSSYTKLVEAGAARIVRDSDSLATAVSHIVAPDQAAAMAHAGWDVVSSGAELTDAVITEIFDRIDSEEAR
ncbi:3-deoxy-D-manno-octulosonic acid transferase [Tropicibacter oceani]|uniref:3-deoxy-D-manno-octulosonic acid transferase n=1 Tax=Tropicibacter oceani TaxID=3058420 RepID=A0ABY8QJQ8_9RHOB|nr:glycosyltransferase N-terminal domain-containing protein [Tropicibacter oceani]WGW04047.1 glycosyltransferase N-terminal domain-containing protein [Tropicibacter oceani]